MCLLSCSSHVRLFAAQWTVAHQAPLSPGRNTGVGCHALLQGIFQKKGVETAFLRSPVLADRFFTTSTTWVLCKYLLNKWIDRWNDIFPVLPLFSLHTHTLSLTQGSTYQALYFLKNLPTSRPNLHRCLCRSRIGRNYPQGSF